MRRPHNPQTVHTAKDSTTSEGKPRTVDSEVKKAGSAYRVPNGVARKK